MSRIRFPRTGEGERIAPMTVNDLRSYLDALERKGLLNRVTREVSLEHELADVAAAMERAGAGAPGSPACAGRAGKQRR